MAGSHLYEQIARNKRNSLILIVSVVLLIAAAGYLFGVTYGDPLIGLSIAIAFALFYAAISFWTGDKLVLATMGARPVTKAERAQLFNIVEEMSIAAGLPPPRIYLIQSAASNAFATGRSPEKASITVTTGLLEIVNREELQAVIAHEMAHIKNFDTRFAILMAVMVGAMALLCDAFWRGLRGRGSVTRVKGQAQIVFFVLALALALLAPIAAKIIQFAMSRHRELLADNTAAELTRNPGALAHALEKIAADPDPLDIANRGTQHLFIVNPLTTVKELKKMETGKPAQEKVGWFDTHPPVGMRVRNLKEMAHIGG